MTEDEQQGGRVFFSSAGRSLEGEDEIRLLSVGVDIGSSTSHLVFSRLVLERVDNRYVVTTREVFHESDVLLTPYADDMTIDATKLGQFVSEQYRQAGVEPSTIDTGALILTGVAVRRRNARAIGDLFAAEAGKFVSVSAGDGLETTLAAFGSGAVARSIREKSRVMNIDIGGGTSKIAVAADGEIADMTAIDIGARVICVDDQRRITRIEESGKRFGAELGLKLDIGVVLPVEDANRIVARMADRLFECISQAKLSAETASLLRLDAMANTTKPQSITFSGGVSEYIYGREQKAFGDLGPFIAAAIKARVEGWGVPIAVPDQGIRATVVGASQYTIQVSGSTIFVEPKEVLPRRNMPVVVPDLNLEGDELDQGAIATAIEKALRRLDLHEGHQAVAMCFSWDGSATFRRLDDFCKGVAKGLKVVLANGHPLVLVSDGDIGGLIGIHAYEEAKLGVPIVSVDGIALKEFDFIDIGAIIETSGAVPVVIKSLVFPTTAALGKIEA